MVADEEERRDFDRRQHPIRRRTTPGEARQRHRWRSPFVKTVASFTLKTPPPPRLLTQAAGVAKGSAGTA